MISGQKSPRRAVRNCLIVLVFMGLVMAACTNDRSGSSEIDALPADSEVFTPDGSTTTLSQFRGQPVVLNFFAAWCGPCRAELPEFEEVSRELAAEVQFVGVSVDFNEDQWLSLVEESGVSYPTVFQPSQELFKASESLGMPTTVFLDADGATQFTFTGPLTKERLTDLIAEHLS